MKLYLLSGYEVKNNGCLFKRHFFKQTEEWWFPSFILVIFTFLFQANEESDDVINSPSLIFSLAQ